ncbi:MAG: hypothetical protein ACYDBB_02690 [Armatimonadota bacterium]
MTEVFYIAFIVERDIFEGRELVVEAGVDLLAGPFPTEAAAVTSLRETFTRYPTCSAFAALAAHIAVKGQRQPPAHISVIPVRQDHCVRYNARHAAVLPWPPSPIQAVAA